MRVLVTGGAGFIGANLCKRLTQEPGISAVVAFDDLSSGTEANLDGLDVRLVRGSILDSNLIAAECSDADAIVHLAARPSVPRSVADPVPTHEVNATGALNVLQASRKNDAHVILASSSSVYGANTVLPKSEKLVPQPMSPYAVSKLAAESYAIAWGYSYGSAVLPFRFFNVYGPLQSANHAYAAVVPAFITAGMERRPLEVFGDGSQTRDFTHVDTVCSVIIDAIVRRVTVLDPVNLAFGTQTALTDLIDLIRDLPGLSNITVRHGEPRVGDVRYSSADPSRLLALFPEVEVVPLQMGLQSTYGWLRESLPGR